MDENENDQADDTTEATTSTRRHRSPNRSKAELIAIARAKLAKLEGRAAQADYSNDPRVIELDKQISAQTALTLKYQRWTDATVSDTNPNGLPAFELAIANFQARIAEWEAKGADALANGPSARATLQSLKDQRSALLREIAGQSAPSEQVQAAQA